MLNKMCNRIIISSKLVLLGYRCYLLALKCIPTKQVQAVKLKIISGIHCMRMTGLNHSRNSPNLCIYRPGMSNILKLTTQDYVKYQGLRLSLKGLGTTTPKGPVT